MHSRWHALPIALRLQGRRTRRDVSDSRSAAEFDRCAAAFALARELLGEAGATGKLYSVGDRAAGGEAEEDRQLYEEALREHAHTLRMRARCTEAYGKEGAVEAARLLEAVRLFESQAGGAGRVRP